mgnify:CR=1 FL=1
MLERESKIEQKEREEELSEIEKFIPQIPEPGECDEADIVEWFQIDKDSGYEILDEDEIVNLVQAEDNLLDEKEGAADESDEEERGPSDSAAFAA